MMTNPTAMQSYLPVFTTPFVGRQQELADIAARLHDENCRLLTLVGPGGAGKTRLAIEAAAQAAAFPDGTYFVALQSLCDSNLIDSAVIDALSIPSYGQTDLRQQVLTHLSDKHLLLILDNFEHLLDDVSLVSDLLMAAPCIKLLITSREILNLQEEWLYHVDGMRYPAAEAAEPLENYSAVQLFVQCARRAQPQFSLEENQVAVRRICELVAGMPLAIELAAAWLKRLSCKEIARELERGLDILETSARNIPERHRSMRLVMAQSWAALTPDEQTVFKRLSVFRGGFRREAAEIIAGASLRTMAALVDKSFLRLDMTGRYDIHELLRQYGEEHLLADAADLYETTRRHSVYYAQKLDQLEKGEMLDSEKEWLEGVLEIIDNVRSAFQWSVNEGHVPNIYKLLGGLSSYYQLRYDFQEAVATFTAAVDRLKSITYPDAELQQRTLASSLTCQAWYLIAYDRKHEALAILEEALALLRPLPHNEEIANVLWRIAFLYTENGILDLENRFEIGQRYANEALEITRAMETSFFTIDSLDMLAQFAYEQGDFARAKAFITESLGLAQKYCLYWAASSACTHLCNIYTLEDDLPTAERYGLEALAQSHLMSDKWTQVHANFSMGMLNYTRSDYAKMHQHFKDGLIAGNNLGDMWVSVTAHSGMGVANWYLVKPAEAWADLQTSLQLALSNTRRPDLLPIALVGIAEVLVCIGRHETAIELFTLLANSVFSRYIIKNSARKFLRKLESLVNPAVFAAAQARATSLILADTARAWLNTSIPTLDAVALSPETAVDTVLTEREQEILRLIAVGLSNKAIADQLILSIGTVKWYVNQIFSKLHVTNRTGAVARGRELGLLA